MGDVIDVLASTTDGSGGIGPGVAGFLVFVFLILAVVFLYRSMRKQLKRIDFDAEGQTDAERMRGRQTPPDGPDTPGRGVSGR